MNQPTPEKVSDWIYKILPEEEWTEAQRDGQFRGSGVDLADGYIHFSTADQVQETAAKHFADRNGLWLLAVDRAALAQHAGDRLIFEPSRGGALFPHLYTSLPVELVVCSEPMPWIPGQGHRFPNWLR